MIAGPRNRSQQLIYQRRASDQKVSDMQTKLKQEFHQNQFANWQNKGNKIQVANQVKLQMQRMRQQSRRDLEYRRQRLAKLLENEAIEYQNEIIANQETPQQTRQRMAERVKHLKQNKEQQRKQQVNAKLERRFEQNADELRKVDQQLKELKTAYERNIQIVERQNRLQNQYEEQMLFAELNLRDQRKKQQIERLKIIEQKQKVHQRNAILAIQKQLRNKKAEQEKQLSQVEKQMLRNQWERQTQLEKLKEIQSIQKHKQATHVLKQQNEKVKRFKEEQIRLQKIRDKDMIDRILQKQRQLSEYEKFMKQQERAQAKKVLSGVRNKNLEMQAYQKQLDKLIQIQRLKKERKEQQNWQRREQARVKLLYDVYDDRGARVKKHQVQRQQEKRNKQQQKIQVIDKLKQHETEQERMRQRDLIRAREQQKKLLEQIARKEEQRRIKLIEIQKDQQEMERGRMDYDARIQDRKVRGKQDLQAFKETNRLF